MNCPNCNSENITTQTVTEWFPYGDIEQAFQATFPAMTCSNCQFGWRDERSEEAIDAAMQDYREGQEAAEEAADDIEKRVTEFSEKVRDTLTSEFLKPGDDVERFREALLLLAAEL